MGANNGKEFYWDQNDEYRVVEKNLNDGTVLLVKSQTEQEYIGRQLICGDREEQQEIRRLIEQKINNRNQYLTKLVAMNESHGKQYCYSNKIFYLLFEKPGATLKDEILTKRIQNQKFSEQEIAIILESGIKGLRALKNVSQPHQNISSTSFFVSSNRQVILSDPWMTPPLNNALNNSSHLLQNALTCPSPEKIQFQNDQILEYCPYRSDLFSLGMVLLEALYFQHMDTMYEKGFRRVIEEKIQHKIAGVHNKSLQDKLKVLLAFNPRDRDLSFSWFRNENAFTESEARRRQINKIKEQMKSGNSNRNQHQEGAQWEEFKSLYQQGNISNISTLPPSNYNFTTAQNTDKTHVRYSPNIQGVNNHQQPTHLHNYPPSNYTNANYQSYKPFKENLQTKSASNYYTSDQYKTQNYGSTTNNYTNINPSNTTVKFTQNFQKYDSYLSGYPKYNIDKIENVQPNFVIDKKPQQTLPYIQKQSNNIKSQYVTVASDYQQNYLELSKESENQVLMSTNPVNGGNANEGDKVEHLLIYEKSPKNDSGEKPQNQLNTKNQVHNQELKNQSLNDYHVLNSISIPKQQSVTSNRTPIDSFDAVSKEESLNNDHHQPSETNPANKAILKEQTQSQTVLNSFPQNKIQQLTPQRRPKYKFNSTIKQVSESSYEQNSSEGVALLNHAKGSSKQSQPTGSSYVEQEYETGFYYGHKINGMRNGKGKFVYKEGSVYNGEWKDNMMNGNGILYYPNGKIAYEGEWKMDQFHGHGSVYNHDESIEIKKEVLDYQDLDQINNHWIFYGGDLFEDRRHGKGKIKFDNGQIFTGNFVGDIADGEGKFYRLNGQVIQGIWKNNKLIKETQ